MVHPHERRSNHPPESTPSLDRHVPTTFWDSQRGLRTTASFLGSHIISMTLLSTGTTTNTDPCTQICKTERNHVCRTRDRAGGGRSSEGRACGGSPGASCMLTTLPVAWSVARQLPLLDALAVEACPAASPPRCKAKDGRVATTCARHDERGPASALLPLLASIATLAECQESYLPPPVSAPPPPPPDPLKAVPFRAGG